MSNNINGFSVNPNTYIPSQQYQNTNNGGNQVVLPSGQQSFKNDGYAFDLSTLPTGKVPTNTKAGFWEKLSGFGDVMNTQQNVQAYKTFEANLYLQAGSGDSTRVMDLQRKLKFLGYSVNTNGNFGPATEKAVTQFKNNMGINDGFLDKKGNYAVTSMVSTTTMNMINSKVASKLNNPGQVDVPNIGKQELDWAKSLRTKMIAGYKPSAEERKQYEAIYQKQQMVLSANNGTYTAGTLPGPSATEIAWAKDFIVRVKQYGAKPTQEEVAKYNDIQRRQQMSKVVPNTSNVVIQNQTTLPTGNKTVFPIQQPSITQDDLNWAKSFANALKNGHQPTQEQVDKYNRIYNAQKAAQQQPQTQQNQQVNTNQTQTTIGQVSPTEYAWAKDFENRVNSGQYKPNQNEVQMYSDIFNRLKAGGANQTQQTQPQTGPVSVQEMQWAQNLEKALEQGHQITPQEKSNYEGIFSRWQQFGMKKDEGNTQVQPQNNTQQANFKPPTEEEVKWALELEQKAQTGYKASPEEVAKYNDIAAKLNEMNNANAAAGKTQTTAPQNPAKNNTSQQETLPEEIQNNTGTQPFSYNDENLNLFRNTFQGVEFGGRSVPILPNDVGLQVAQKYGFSSVEELQSRIGAKVDGKFGPETLFRLQNALNRTTKPSTETTAPQQTQNVTNTGNTNQGVSPQELQWASQFIEAVRGGYQASEEQKAQYRDIFNRHQASGGSVVQNTSPTTNTPNFSAVSSLTINANSADPDLNWALQLLDAVRTKGYTPTEEEHTKYEQIMARNTVAQ
ncbi:MAG: peptidoglycan-binding domain-containing protein [Candidatus Sericytochromatia bacterium]